MIVSTQKGQSVNNFIKDCHIRKELHKDFTNSLPEKILQVDPKKTSLLANTLLIVFTKKKDKKNKRQRTNKHILLGARDQYEIPTSVI